MEHPVSVRLRHAGVNVVAGVAELSDLLGQQLDALGRVAEDDALVDLLHERIDQRLSSRFQKIGLRIEKNCVKAMNPAKYGRDSTGD